MGISLKIHLQHYFVKRSQRAVVGLVTRTQQLYPSIALHNPQHVLLTRNPSRKDSRSEINLSAARHPIRAPSELSLPFQPQPPPCSICFRRGQETVGHAD